MGKMKHKEVRKLIKQNEFQDALVNAKEYFEKNTENIIIASVVVLIIIIAVPLYINNKKQKEVKAEQLLSQANHFVNRPVSTDENAAMYGFFTSKEEKFDKATTAYMEVLQGYKGTKSIPPAYLGLANAYYNNGQYKEAIEYYNSFIEKFPEHDLLPEAISGRAYTLFQQEKYGEAAQEWEKVLADFPGVFTYYDIMLKIADCYVKIKDNAKAKELYEKIVKEKKGSHWATSAEAKLKKIGS